MLSNEEIEKLIEDMTKVRPEMLNEEALKLFNTIMKIIDERDTLIQERDYYKARYNEFNDYFLKNNMTIEQMLKELKRSKLYERSTEDDKDKMRHMQRRGNEAEYSGTIQKEDRLLR